jgi:hypothetical protein
MQWRHTGEWGYSSTILDLGTRWRWLVSFTLLPLYPRGKSPRHPLDRRLGGRQSRCGCCGEEKNLALPGIEPGPSSQSLYRLSYPDSQINKYNLLKWCFYHQLAFLVGKSGLFFTTYFGLSLIASRWIFLWLQKDHQCDPNTFKYCQNFSKFDFLLFLLYKFEIQSVVNK